MFGIDPLYWLIMAPVLAFSLWTSFRVKRAFSTYSKIEISSGRTGAQVAEMILAKNGLSKVPVVETEGFLSDHYDPSKKEVHLSPEVYESTSIAAIGVAAHETGHAIQHAQSYGPLMLRTALAPTASIGSNLSWIIILAGAVLGLTGLIKIGIVLFSVVVFFQIITLPVEFNASSRAKELLVSYGMVTGDETVNVQKMLSAAAMTYVAAAASAIATLLYFILRAGVIGRHDD